MVLALPTHGVARFFRVCANSLMCPPATPRRFVAYQICHVTLLIERRLQRSPGFHCDAKGRSVNPSVVSMSNFGTPLWSTGKLGLNCSYLDPSNHHVPVIKAMASSQSSPVVTATAFRAISLPPYYPFNESRKISCRLLK